MTQFAHATLQRLAYVRRGDSTTDPTVQLEGPALEVQFNPGSLRLTRRNNVDRNGVTAKSQKRNHASAEGGSLGFTLEFDTAEQGDTGRRVDVRGWTALLRQFVEPPDDRSGNPPPAVRFSWGTLIFDGIIDEITEQLGHFAPDGTPLRATVAVTIAEQNFAFEAKKQGNGARRSRGATEPGGSTGAAPGSTGSTNPDRVETARENESVQQVLARTGLAPEAWRGAMTGLDSPLGLPAGTGVQLGPEVARATAADVVTGAARRPLTGGDPGAGGAGFAAEASATSVSALAGALDAGAAARGGAEGFVLAAAGGVDAAAAAVAAVAAEAASEAGRLGFASPPAGLPAGGGPAAVAGAVAALGRVPDPRALSYGRGIPLTVRTPRPAGRGW